MHPHLVFWISAAVRMIIVLAGASVVGFFWGLIAGLAAAMAGMIVKIGPIKNSARFALVGTKISSEVVR